MSAALVVGAVVIAVVGLFLLWVYLMNRRDEREAQRERERVRRSEPPVLGNPKPRHPWRR
jgi:hypothetical protein